MIVEIGGDLPLNGVVVNKDSGCETCSTSMRMEITAAINAISYCLGNLSAGNYVLYTDSKVVVNAVNDWIPNWKSLGWKRPQGKKLLNKELWMLLDELTEMIDVEFKWVKSHNGLKYNEMADELAEKAIKDCEDKED